MASRTIVKSELPSFESVNGIESLVAFFQARQIRFSESESAFKITPQHTLKLAIIDEISQEVTEQKRKQLLDDKIARFGLLVNKNFEKFRFIRPKEHPNTFTFDKTKHPPHERLQSIYLLLDSIEFSNQPYNDSLLNLFEIRELVDRFYKEYRTVRDKLAKQIRGFRNGAASLFAQVILDRIIFIYFLQAKGILDKDYIQTLFERSLERETDFYESYLKPLFFELLNSDDEGVKAKYRAEFGEVPYLNGGLFRRREFETEDSAIPNVAWKSVFDLFEDYVWVIEDTESGGLTPEVLGHIFEMTMNEGDRKRTASYYTPSEATRLICEQVITRFLVERVQSKFSEKLDSFDLIVRQNNKELLEFAYSTLHQVRIVDPAVGSGAFLIAAENILVDYLYQLYEKLNQLGSSAISEDRDEIQRSRNSPIYHFKKLTMTENLYGVELNPDGVEICKLRLWLSMITNVTNIEPLPNIEFNVRQGNSLLGFTKSTADVGDSATFEDAESLSFQSINYKLAEKNKLIEAYRQEHNTGQAGELKSQIDKLTARFREQFDRKLDVKLGPLAKELHLQPWYSPFHWVMEFSDVLKAGGFDIVVGNPPFTKNELIPKMYKQALNVVLSDYAAYTAGQLGLYGYFIVLCDKILKPDGRAAYVLPSMILRLDSTLGLRKMLTEHATIENIFIRTTTPAFSNDTSLREIILIFRKGNSDAQECQLVFVGELTARERELLRAKAGNPSVSSLKIRTIKPQELKANVNNMFTFVAAHDAKLHEVWEDFSKSAKLVSIAGLSTQTSCVIVRGIETKSKDDVPVQATYILRETARAEKKSDVWVLSDVSKDMLAVKNRFDGTTVNIPISAVKHALRSHSTVASMDLSHLSDYVVADDFPQSAKFFVSLKYSKIKRLLASWRRYVESRLSNVVLLRRFDMSGDGTTLYAYYSSTPIAGAGVDWDVRGLSDEDSRIFCMWFNSTPNVLQVFLNRIETRGAWINLHEYALNDLHVINPKSLTKEERQILLDTFENVKDVRFPSLLTQLHEKFDSRRSIDKAVLRALQFKPEQINEILDHLYPSLADEIERLKALMAGKGDGEIDDETS